MTSTFSSRVCRTCLGHAASHLLHAVPAHLSDWMTAMWSETPEGSMLMACSGHAFMHFLHPMHPSTTPVRFVPDFMMWTLQFSVSGRSLTAKRVTLMFYGGSGRVL